MAVHVSESAYVHENVEAKLMPGAEWAKHFIVPSSVAQSSIDNLSATNFAEVCHGAPDLSIGMKTVLIQQGRREFHFEWLVIEKVHQRS